MIDAGVYPAFSNLHKDGPVHPTNLSSIQERLEQPRRSLSPSRFTDADFLEFQVKDHEAQSHVIILKNILPLILGSSNVPEASEILFTNIKSVPADNFTQLKPDIYDGVDPSNLDANIRNILSRYIEPSKNSSCPCLPNAYIEVKGKNQSPQIGQYQALHDGLIGERAMLKIIQYANNDESPNNAAHTIAAIYHAGDALLTLYTMHAIQRNEHGEQERIGYRQTQLTGFKMDSRQDQWIAGATTLRNAREWAREQHENAVTKAHDAIDPMLDFGNG
ncbi:uncharacterized protein KY384_008021 [Bacidia gigantensis]|uniref:uncharacterized protein n=1 Tax=Bacidia gigantensis TaxID=2732470 RepID=UPI001D03E2B6|nr:uncharacterized protein KY384_008021 [Bacidia gigantensis]KAG8527277.1 hypothetical protein KY384_008021 [Bacidia gigantensis]